MEALSTFRVQSLLYVKRKTSQVQDFSTWEEALSYVLKCVSPSRKKIDILATSSTKNEIEEKAAEDDSTASLLASKKERGEFPLCILSGHMVQIALQRANSDGLARYDRFRSQQPE